MVNYCIAVSEKIQIFLLLCSGSFPVILHRPSCFFVARTKVLFTSKALRRGSFEFRMPPKDKTIMSFDWTKPIRYHCHTLFIHRTLHHLTDPHIEMNTKSNHALTLQRMSGRSIQGSRREKNIELRALLKQQMYS